MNQRSQTFLPYNNFLYWLLLISLIGFFVYLSIELGVLGFILSTDKTRISLLILILFIFGSFFVGIRQYLLSRQIISLSDILKSIQGNKPISLLDVISNKKHSTSLAADYLSTVRKSSNSNITQQGEIFAESITGSYKAVWFVSGILIKLGLLGTVIGFVIMLGTVSDLEELDISGVKQLMQQMTTGMGIAMYTTMTGLISSMLLSLQCLMLEKSSDKFIATTLKLGHELSTDKPTERI